MVWVIAFHYFDSYIRITTSCPLEWHLYPPILCWFTHLSWAFYVLTCRITFSKRKKSIFARDTNNTEITSQWRQLMSQIAMNFFESSFVKKTVLEYDSKIFSLFFKLPLEDLFHLLLFHRIFAKRLLWNRSAFNCRINPSYFRQRRHCLIQSPLFSRSPPSSSSSFTSFSVNLLRKGKVANIGTSHTCNFSVFIVIVICLLMLLAEERELEESHGVFGVILS